jgi:hypothetical protein
MNMTQDRNGSTLGNVLMRIMTQAFKSYLSRAKV